MGRPREHGERTAAALLDAAERLIQIGGIEAVSVRRLADATGTTTRAVYALFGSKDGLLAALGTRAFELLGAAVRALPATDDPADDLVTAGADVFRRFVVEHPILFRIGFQRTLVTTELAGHFDAARVGALAALTARLERLGQAGLLRRHSVNDARAHFHALCQGLADCELQGILAPKQAARVWRDALDTLIAGFAIPEGAISAAASRTAR